VSTSEVARRAEERWQRATLETMLFAAVGRRAGHWHPPPPPMVRPYCRIPQDWRTRDAQAYIAGIRFDRLPEEGRKRMQGIWGRRGDTSKA
jgi:hypothetical protein